MTAHKYTIMKDLARGHYEVVRWVDHKPVVIQTNIKTKAKAITALRIWKQRDRLAGARDGSS